MRGSRHFLFCLSALLILTVAGSLDSRAQKASDSLPEIPPYLLPPPTMLSDHGDDRMSSRLFQTTSTRSPWRIA